VRQITANVPKIEAETAIDGVSVFPWKIPLATAIPMGGATNSDAIARTVPTRYSLSYRSELHNTYIMAMAARLAPPQIAPPMAPAAIEDDICMVRMWASLFEHMSIRR